MTIRRYLAVAALAVWVVGNSPVSAPAAERAVATLAHIKLSGDLDEAPLPADPLFATGMENFKSKLDRIKKARGDASIDGLYLHLTGLGIGWGKVDELRRAIADCRKSGKKVFAYLESGDSKDYLVALACDEICVPESGWLFLTGLRAEISFYKDLLEKIGVRADMLQMGDFKGAAEPYTRSSMSPQLRKQLETVLDDYYERSFVQEIAQGRPGRKWTAEQVRKLIDQGPYTAKSAQAAGLVDRVAYLDQHQEALKTVLNAEQVKLARNYARAKAEEPDFSNPFAILKLLSPPKSTSSSKPKIAVIYAVGAITTGSSLESLLGGQTVGSSTMIEAIRQAEQDKTVKAIVLRVDSPGGSALASDLIWNELVQCKKPVVASMGDTAASGGYYISMAARKIYAEPGTLTGSIGVVGGKMVIGGLQDLVGLKTEIITRGANANILSSTTPFSENERKAMTALMKDVYDQFLDKALKGRARAGKTMTRPDLEKLAGGRVWTGRQAKENQLIDELGTLEDAIASAKEMAGVAKTTELELLILPKAKSFFDTLLDNRGDTTLPGTMRQQFLRELPELAGQIRGADALLRLRGEPVWVVLPMHVSVR